MTYRACRRSCCAEDALMSYFLLIYPQPLSGAKLLTFTPIVA